MQILDKLDDDDIQDVCVATIYNMFGFLGLDKGKTMTRKDLVRFLKENIKTISQN